MRRIRRLFSALAIAGTSWFIATPLYAAQPSTEPSAPPSSQGPTQGQTQGPSASMAKRITTTATVEKIDAQKRQVMLRGEDGTEFTVDVPQSMKLEQIHEGDRVKIDYYEAIGISLKKREAGAPAGAGETKITERNAGTLPGGMVARQITGTVEVVKVDRANNRLTVRRPNGAVDTISVTNPAMQAQLANVHEGDRIQVTYTEAAAIKLMREGGTKPSGGQGGSQGSSEPNR